MRESAALVGAFLLACALGGGAPDDGPALESYRRARATLDTGVQAIGGLDALAALTTVVREMTGVRTDSGQGLVATDTSHNRPSITAAIDYQSRRAAVALQDVITGGQPLRFQTIIGPDKRHHVDHVHGTVSTGNADPSSILPELRRYPEGLLRAALSRPESLRWIGQAVFEDRAQDVIAYADADGVVVNLSFDAQSHELTKSETLRYDSLLGDGTSEYVFRDNRPVDSLKLPFRYIERRAGAILQDLTALSIRITPDAANTFSPPAGLRQVDPPRPEPIVKLAENVYAVMSGYNSLAVAFPDYFVVLEAGGNSRSTEQTIDRLHKIAPGKPIRYVVATHFHHDHLGGLRSYVAEGSTIVTTASGKYVIETRLLPSTHTMRPDRLTRTPRPATIEVVDGKRVFEGGSMRLEVIDIGPSPHVREMLIGYLPAQKVLFEADLLDLPPDADVPVAGDDTKDLMAKVEALGLDVERIVSVHGRLGTIADLRRATQGKALR